MYHTTSHSHSSHLFKFRLQIGDRLWQGDWKFYTFKKYIFKTVFIRASICKHSTCECYSIFWTHFLRQKRYTLQQFGLFSAITAQNSIYFERVKLWNLNTQDSKWNQHYGNRSSNVQKHNFSPRSLKRHSTRTFQSLWSYVIKFSYLLHFLLNMCLHDYSR